MEHRRSIFGPLLLITAGAIWLLVQSGRIPAANLWALTHIWPFLLIAAGLGIILRPYWSYTSLVLDVLVLGGTVLAIYFAPQLGWANPTMFYMMGNNDFFVGPSEAGSGKMVTESRKASNFDSIEVSYPAQVFISQGSSESVKIEADDNLLPGLRTEVDNDTLKIYYRVENGKHVNPTRAVKITIVVKELKELHFESAGELTLDGIETDDLEVSVSGAGNLMLNEISVNSLAVSLSGAGNVSASGSAEALSLAISGVGKFDGQDLHSQVADANLSGVGSATVWVDDELDAVISGAGSVNYYGAADVTEQVGGLGSVNHVGDK